MGKCLNTNYHILSNTLLIGSVNSIVHKMYEYNAYLLYFTVHTRTLTQYLIVLCKRYTKYTYIELSVHLHHVNKTVDDCPF